MKRTLLCALAISMACAQATAPESGPIRIVTFGDSNTDIAFRDSVYVGAGYLNVVDPPAPDAPNLPESLAGKIERLDSTIHAVNHGIAATNSGDGRVGSSPNAREPVNGVTRFEAEVLGKGYPWSGGELPVPVIRTRAFVPSARDYAYISIGTNDRDATKTAANIRWMVAQWTNRPDHLFLTTLPPATNVIPATNDSIRAIAKETGVRLIDISAHVSDDGGYHWRNDQLHVGDQRHYRESVRAWIAEQIVSAIHESGR